MAYLNSEVSALNGRLEQLERMPSHRDSRPSRQDLQREGAKNWSNFKGQMGWE